MWKANSFKKTQMLGKVEGRRSGWQDEMVGWYHWLNGHEFEQTPGDGEGQGSLACCSPCGHKELDMTEQLNDNNNPIRSQAPSALLHSVLSSLFMKSSPHPNALEVFLLLPLPHSKFNSIFTAGFRGHFLYFITTQANLTHSSFLFPHWLYNLLSLSYLSNDQLSSKKSFPIESLFKNVLFNIN